MFYWSDSLQLTPEAEEKVRESREVIDTFIREDKGMMCLLSFFQELRHSGSRSDTCFVCVFRCSCVRRQHGFWKVCAHSHTRRATGVSKRVNGTTRHSADQSEWTDWLGEGVGPQGHHRPWCHVIGPLTSGSFVDIYKLHTH